MNHRTTTQQRLSLLVLVTCENNLTKDYSDYIAPPTLRFSVAQHEASWLAK